MLKWNRKRPGKVIWAQQFSLDGTESRKIALRKSSKKFSVWLRLQSSAVVRCACPLKSVYFWTQKVRQYPKWILRITLKASWSYRRIIPKFDKMVILKIFKKMQNFQIFRFFMTSIWPNTLTVKVWPPILWPEFDSATEWP